jgi:hypothetical protein
VAAQVGVLPGVPALKCAGNARVRRTNGGRDVEKLVVDGRPQKPDDHFTSVHGPVSSLDDEFRDIPR